MCQSLVIQDDSFKYQVRQEYEDGGLWRKDMGEVVYTGFQCLEKNSLCLEVVSSVYKHFMKLQNFIFITNLI